MSLLAWIAFGIVALMIVAQYMSTGDAHFLMYAIPMLFMIFIIPMVLRMMSQQGYVQAEDRYRKNARYYRIEGITLKNIGDAVKIYGVVKKATFRWLKRPHFDIEDETDSIKVIMFTSPLEDIKVGDKVEVLGMVMKSLFKRTKPTISAVSIKRVKA
ncbi:MAG: hypothetical protein J7J85_08795 [Deltaproteobacteria bacterium]|nr:hypothetical protein [Deltaproteobacteria bacterium]